MNDWRAGFSKALLRPSSAASTAISQKRIAPPSVSRPRSERLHAHRALQDHHQPALVHAIGDHAAVGREQQHGQRLQRAITSPRSVLERVSVYTSHDCAVICIHVPTSETDWPAT